MKLPSGSQLHFTQKAIEKWANTHYQSFSGKHVIPKITQLFTESSYELHLSFLMYVSLLLFNQEVI